MTAWGAGAVGMAVEAGLVGAWLILAVLVTRPTAAWRARILLLGLVQFLVPPLVALPFPRPVLVMGPGGASVPGDYGAILAAVGGLQLAGLAVGFTTWVRARVALRGVLRRATEVREGRLYRRLRTVADGQGVAPPRLFLTQDAGPGAVGTLRSAILLPRELTRSLDDDALRMVLAHEVAHVARRDALSALLRRLVLSLWWFHPLAWALTRLHRAAAEDACDDIATAAHDPEAYGHALVAAAHVPPPATAAGLAGHPLGRRLRRLLRPARRPPIARALDTLGPGLPAAIAVVALIAAPLGLPAPAPPGEATTHTSRIVIEPETIIRHVID